MTAALCFLAALIAGVLGLFTGWFPLLLIALLLVGAGAVRPSVPTFSMSNEEFQERFESGSSSPDPVERQTPDPDAAVVVGHD